MLSLLSSPVSPRYRLFRDFGSSLLWLPVSSSFRYSVLSRFISLLHCFIFPALRLFSLHFFLRYIGPLFGPLSFQLSHLLLFHFSRSPVLPLVPRLSTLLLPGYLPTVIGYPPVHSTQFSLRGLRLFTYDSRYFRSTPRLSVLRLMDLLLAVLAVRSGSLALRLSAFTLRLSALFLTLRFMGLALR